MIRRKQLEHEEPLRVANERLLKFKQFLYSHMNQSLGGGYIGFGGDDIDKKFGDKRK